MSPAMNALDKKRLTEAFALLGTYLLDRGRFVELCVYGGSALVMTFDWRSSTEDVDAVVRTGSDERDLGGSVAAVAASMDLDPDWLNDAVGAFTPLDEDDAWFDVSGDYPDAANPGLRVFLAKPAYMLALKLAALTNPDRLARDLTDAAELATVVGTRTPDDLDVLYRRFHGEAPTATVRALYPAVLEPAP